MLFGPPYAAGAARSIKQFQFVGHGTRPTQIHSSYLVETTKVIDHMDQHTTLHSGKPRVVNLHVPKASGLGEEDVIEVVGHPILCAVWNVLVAKLEALVPY